MAWLIFVLTNIGAMILGVWRIARQLIRHYWAGCLLTAALLVGVILAWWGLKGMGL